MVNFGALMQRVERLRVSQATVEQLDNQFLDQFNATPRVFDGVPASVVKTEGGDLRITTDLGTADAHVRLVIDGDSAKLEYRFLVQVEDQSAEVFRVYLEDSGVFTHQGGGQFGYFNQISTVKDMAVGVLDGILESSLYHPTPAA